MDFIEDDDEIEEEVESGSVSVPVVAPAPKKPQQNFIVTPNPQPDLIVNDISSFFEINLPIPSPAIPLPLSQKENESLKIDFLPQSHSLIPPQPKTFTSFESPKSSVQCGQHLISENDLIWGKIPEGIWWPAKYLGIREFPTFKPNGKAIHFVLFLGVNIFYFLSPEDMQPYEEYESQHISRTSQPLFLSALTAVQLEREKSYFLDDLHCESCGSNDEAEQLLLCDRCEKAIHFRKCLNPPLNEIPHGDWFCPFCVEAISRGQPAFPTHSSRANSIYPDPFRSSPNCEFFTFGQFFFKLSDQLDDFKFDSIRQHNDRFPSKKIPYPLLNRPERPTPIKKQSKSPQRKNSTNKKISSLPISQSKNSLQSNSLQSTSNSLQSTSNSLQSTSNSLQSTSNSLEKTNHSKKNEVPLWDPSSMTSTQISSKIPPK